MPRHVYSSVPHAVRTRHDTDGADTILRAVRTTYQVAAVIVNSRLQRNINVVYLSS